LEFIVKIKKSGSVRVDLLGGTIDLPPINLILSNVVTLNLATSLKAEVTLERRTDEVVEIASLDYGVTKKFSKDDFRQDKIDSGFFGDLTFIALILAMANVTSGVTVTLKSGSPPGAGLGGSSAMGVTLYSALCEFNGWKKEPREIISLVNSLEGKMLDKGPAGYQDYYPAMYGGVLALISTPGLIKVEQLFTEELKSELESNMTLVFSGKNRHSGINNWEVYKNFFDRKAGAREGLAEIASLSHQAYDSLGTKDYKRFFSLVIKEGEARERLFSGIVIDEMRTLLADIRKKHSRVGLKVCGAGGGGCFLLVHPGCDTQEIAGFVKKHGMTKLDFKVEKPIVANI